MENVLVALMRGKLKQRALKKRVLANVKLIQKKKNTTQHYEMISGS